MLQNNPYSVLLETISFENVQKMGELITLKTLKAQSAYAQGAFNWLYIGLIKDLNRCGELYYQVQHLTKKMTVHINLCYNKFTTTKITRRNI